MWASVDVCRHMTGRRRPTRAAAARPSSGPLDISRKRVEYEDVEIEGCPFGFTAQKDPKGSSKELDDLNGPLGSLEALLQAFPKPIY